MFMAKFFSILWGLDIGFYDIIKNNQNLKIKSAARFSIFMMKSEFSIFQWNLNKPRPAQKTKIGIPTKFWDSDFLY